LVLAKLSGNLANLPGGPWPEHAHSAVVLPIASAGEGYATGVLIAGISPRRAFDEQYRAFFGLVARNLAGAIADVRGYEDQQKRSAVEHQLRSEAELERRWLRESFILAPAGMALLRDPDHRFTFVNSAYLELIGRENDEVIGKTVTEVFPEIKGQGYLELLNRVYETAEPFVATEKELRLKRRGMDEDVVYITFSYQAMTNVAEQVEGILVHAIDVTEQVLARSLLETRVKERTADLQEAEQKLRALNSKLLQTQDDERRRLARDLHDSAGQILVALKMNLFPLEQELAKEHPSLSKVAAGSIELVDDLSKELRTMSHLLHPPLLDEAGLPSAIRWYVEGFAERSGIDVKLKLDPGMPRLSQECETAIFRIVQECLTNIHRHSGSTTASVSVDHSSGRTRVEIADAGSGIPHFDATKKAPKRVGMGIHGMQERVRQLQGQIEIRSGNSGTSVVVILPRQEVSA
jgi:PAS domain S-box-containing protein